MATDHRRWKPSVVADSPRLSDRGRRDRRGSIPRLGEASRRPARRATLLTSTLTSPEATHGSHLSRLRWHRRPGRHGRRRSQDACAVERRPIDRQAFPRSSRGSRAERNHRTRIWVRCIPRRDVPCGDARNPDTVVCHRQSSGREDPWPWCAPFEALNRWGSAAAKRNVAALQTAERRFRHTDQEAESTERVLWKGPETSSGPSVRVPALAGALFGEIDLELTTID
jgi:hypothetical protein